MTRRPTIITRTYTLVPNRTVFRSTRGRLMFQLPGIGGTDAGDLRRRGNAARQHRSGGGRESQTSIAVGADRADAFLTDQHARYRHAGCALLVAENHRAVGERLSRGRQDVLAGVLHSRVYADLFGGPGQ